MRAAVDFYTTNLGFSVDLDAAPAFTAVVRGSGGQQVLLLDPAGNFVKMFQPAPRADTRRRNHLSHFGFTGPGDS